MRRPLVAHTQNLFNISASDRLGLTLFFAVALHAIIILGIGFDAERLLPKERPLTLEVTLVHSESEQAPDKADYLAQANQLGGGTVKEKMRPSSPFPNPRPTLNQEGEAPQNQPMQLPTPQNQSEQQPVLLAQRDSSQQWQKQDKSPTPVLPDTANASELMLSARAIARLSAELRQKQQAYAQMPREKYISANTREYRYASYEDSWRQKVERIGNLNYPDEAKTNKLSGTLLLDVAINPDGSLKSVRIDRSSGHRALDNGAIRIVRMASPFAPLPPEIRKEVDVLHILRVWQFQDDSLQTRR
jgi:protein TonB